MRISQSSGILLSVLAACQSRPHAQINRMSRVGVAWIIALICAGIAMVRPAAAELVLPAAFDYQLIGVPLVATGGPAPINPGVLVGLNPQPLPPLPDPGASLDLTNPGDPLYTYPGTGALENFQFEWGMGAAGQVSFSTPTPTPGDPLQYTFTGTDNLLDVYSIVLNFGGADPGSFVSLNPQPLPPFPDPSFGFLALDFTTAGGDPTVDFTVSAKA